MSEQTTPWSSPPRHFSVKTSEVGIVGVSVDDTFSAWTLAKVFTGFYPGDPPVLVIRFVDLQRGNCSPPDLARVVSGIPGVNELIVDQTNIGSAGAAVFRPQSRPLSPVQQRFVRFSITPPPSDGGTGRPYPGGRHLEVTRSKLIKDVQSAVRGSTEVLDIEFEGSAKSKELIEEIVGAPKTDEHSSSLLAVAVVIYHCVQDRRRLENIDDRRR